MKARDDPDLDAIRDNIGYIPETGRLFWKKVRQKTYIGMEAGGMKSKGYREIRLNGRIYQANRIAWFLHYGVWPTGDIDHRDGDKTNNRIVNLRDKTHRENCQNRIEHRNGKLVGCHFDRQRGKWRSVIWVSGKRRDLGFYLSEIEAHRVYMDYIKNHLESVQEA
jgi:hypothetical protein